MRMGVFVLMGGVGNSWKVTDLLRWGQRMLRWKGAFRSRRSSIQPPAKVEDFGVSDHVVMPAAFQKCRVVWIKRPLDLWKFRFRNWCSTKTGIYSPDITAYPHVVSMKPNSSFLFSNLPFLHWNSHFGFCGFCRDSDKAKGEIRVLGCRGCGK